MDVIVGTAGHIDHGKTALVKALTGTDADRLPDEKRRGITIDLGFAEMRQGETHFGFVDVPGHERFVRNMLAGASGIDLVLLVVAADEGVMPQTREHFDICRLLDIQAGVIALTKSDLVDAETLEIARLDAAELVAGSFLENAAVVAVSSRTGAGIDETKLELERAAKYLRPRESGRVVRMPVDRSFTIKGFGTVVTGTLASGEITADSRLELMPSKTAVRIRGLQTHGVATEKAVAGQRVAVNLAAIDHDDIGRGMTLVEASTLRPTQIIDAEIEVLQDSSRPVATRQRVRVHLGTAELLARVQVFVGTELGPGQRGFVQLRLESPVVTVPGERFIIRSYSPQITIAGGIVIDNLAVRHRRKDLGIAAQNVRERMASGHDIKDMLEVAVSHAEYRGLPIGELQARTGLSADTLINSLDKLVAAGKLVNAGDRYIAAEKFTELGNKVVETLQAFHKADPIASSMSRDVVLSRALPHQSVEIAAAVVASLVSNGTIVAENERLRLSSHSSQLSAADTAFTENILRLYEKAGLEVPRIAEAIEQVSDGSPRAKVEKLLRLVVDSGKLVKVTDEFYFSRTAIDSAAALLRSSGEETVDVAAFKALTDVSRKYAIPLLEYFDREHVTVRVGDKRVILK